MGLLDIFKKKTTTAITRSQQSSLAQTVNQVYQKTGKQISDGLSKPTASTGTPIDKLKGAARFTSQMSNIGGGSKATGGGGMAEGMKTVIRNGQASTAKKMIEDSAHKKLWK